MLEAASSPPAVIILETHLKGLTPPPPLDIFFQTLTSLLSELLFTTLYVHMCFSGIAFKPPTRPQSACDIHHSFLLLGFSAEFHTSFYVCVSWHGVSENQFETNSDSYTYLSMISLLIHLFSAGYTVYLYSRRV